MANEPSSITSLISEFRGIQEKDAVTPDSLGAILQRIVDIIPTRALPADRNTIVPEVRDGELFVYGSKRLLSKGCVPYLFRLTRKRNHIRSAESASSVPLSKGWHLYGSRHTVRVVNNLVQFSTNEHRYIHNVARSYTSSPAPLIHTYVTRGGDECVRWGRVRINTTDYNTGRKRMLRLRFAIGFAPLVDPCAKKVTPLNLVSNLAEFSLIYDTSKRKWVIAI